MKAALKYDVVELILVAVDSSAANDNAHPATRHNVPRGASPLLPHARRRRREVTSPCTDEVCAPSTCKGGARFPQRSEDKRGGGLPNPILFDGGQTNLYVYVGNDAINFQDVTGELPIFVPAVAFAIAIGIGYYKGGVEGAVLAAPAGFLTGLSILVTSPIIGGLGLGYGAIVATDGFQDLKKLVGFGAGVAGGGICSGFTGPGAPIACPFAAEAAEKAATECME